MLQITTTNGDTLIHADQRPDTYNGQSFDGSQYMVHAGEWGRHKYIRKEGNRYIYPEDLQKGNDVQRHHAAVLSDRKAAKEVKKRDKAFLKTKEAIKNNVDAQIGVKGATDAIYKTQQMTNAHQGATGYGGLDSYAYRVADADNAKQIVKARREEKTRIKSNQESAAKQAEDERKKAGTKVPEKTNGPISRKKKVVEGGKPIKKGESLKTVEQRKSAHQGYELDKKMYPDGGSTEELEIQKRKTKARKIMKANKEKTDAQARSAHRR